MRPQALRDGRFMEQDKGFKFVKTLKILFFIFAVHAVVPASATVLWAGSEDVDFPNGAAACTNTTAGRFRSSYARATAYACSGGTYATSNAFAGGAVTSVWLSARTFLYGCCMSNNGAKLIGLAKSGTNSSLWIGLAAGSSSILALWKYDNTTWTQLAAESSGTFAADTITKLDMQVISYGGSATVNIYTNGGASVRVTYTGNVVAGTASTLDSVIITNSGNTGFTSEVIVSDLDTRSLSLVTLAPSLAGTSNAWTGAFTDVNETTISDATLVSTTVSGNNFQCNLTDLPAGSFSIQGVKLVARSMKAGAGITSVAPGIYTSATVNVPTATALSTTWTSVETLYQGTNPVTSSNWTSGDINGLQLNLQSAP